MKIMDFDNLLGSGGDDDYNQNLKKTKGKLELLKGLVNEWIHIIVIILFVFSLYSFYQQYEFIHEFHHLKTIIYKQALEDGNEEMIENLIHMNELHHSLLSNHHNIQNYQDDDYNDNGRRKRKNSSPLPIVDHRDPQEQWKIYLSDIKKKHENELNVFFHMEFVMDGIIGSWRSYPINNFFIFEKLINFDVCCFIESQSICSSTEYFECTVTTREKKHENDDLDKTNFLPSNNILECISKRSELSYARCTLVYAMGE